jgi:cytidylate kinase
MSADARPRPLPDAGAGRLITVSATYGSGGSVVAPLLGKRLGVPYLQRLTTSGGALIEATASGERLCPGEAQATRAHHLLASLSHAPPAGPTQSAPPPRADHQLLRREAEADIKRLAAAGEGVILGRGAAVVLGKQRDYHVRLDGPKESRVARGAAIEGIDPNEAGVHLRAADKARTA